jgi:hypothetical protein
MHFAQSNSCVTLSFHAVRGMFRPKNSGARKFSYVTLSATAIARKHDHAGARSASTGPATCYILISAHASNCNDVQVRARNASRLAQAATSCEQRELTFTSSGRVSDNTSFSPCYPRDPRTEFFLD